jgi:hypothetical protein
MVIEFARRRYPAYAWAFPLAGGRANVGYCVFDRRGAGSRRELLAALHDLLPGERPDPATLRAHHLPLSTSRRHHPDGRVLLAGDAAAVNPVTGGHLRRSSVRSAAGVRHCAARARAGAPGRCAELRASPQPPGGARLADATRPVPRRRGGHDRRDPAVFDAIDFGPREERRTRTPLARSRPPTCAVSSPSHFDLKNLKSSTRYAV